jgi:hypothetical protein
LGLIACQPRGLEPPAKLAPAGKPDDRVTIDEFSTNVSLNEAVEARAVRSPEATLAVTHQIEAMATHVERRSSGVDRVRLRAELARIAKRHAGSGNEGAWLEEATMLLLGYLSDEQAEAELSRVALEALAKDLGDDAYYREKGLGEPAGVTELLPDVRDGIGVVKLRHLYGDMGDRMLALFSGWAALDPPLRAVVLDLSECLYASGPSTVALVNTFAPGQLAYELIVRDEAQRSLIRLEYRGEAAWSSAGFSKLPVFVQLSPRSTVLAEAAALALRRHRGARVLGTLSSGDGRLVTYQRLPWNAWFGFTVADVLASDGTPLRGHPVVPDACVREGELVPLTERTEAAYRGHCGPPDSEIRTEAVLRHVQELLARETTEAAVIEPRTR